MAAVVDIRINTDETWVMSLAYWENKDRTIPVDISTWAFNGSMSFPDKCIPMVFKTYKNEVECRIEASSLLDLPQAGRYTIEASISGVKSRLQQGDIEVDRSSVCS